MPQRSDSVLRVIFDTNIYGFLLQEPNLELVEQKLIHESNLKVYGCQIIRQELRDKAEKKARIALLELYDHITKEIRLEEKAKTDKLAKEYYEEAKSIRKGDIRNWEELREDYTIVAIASAYNLDIVFSHDQKTMLSDYSKEAYTKVNLKASLRTPNFVDYKHLKEAYLK